MNNDLNSFEDYLHGVAFPKYAMSEGLLDDDWPDAEDTWAGNLSIDDLIDLADEYATAKVKAVHDEYLPLIRDIHEKFKKVVDNG